MAEYKVQFEVFEGPLDLLLYLVKKEEVDIYEVNLTKIATQFIEYIELMRQLDLEVAGEFLVMASTLMYIKSRELLRQLVAAKGVLKFSELFEQMARRMEVVVTFLALLELIRLKQIVVSQPAPFSEIEIWRAPALSTTAAAPDTATTASNPQSEISNSQT